MTGSAITVDGRERHLIQHLNALDVSFKSKTMLHGDVRIECGSKVLVLERKSEGDAVASVVDGRLREQLLRWRESEPPNGEQMVLIFESSQTPREDCAIRGLKAPGALNACLTKLALRDGIHVLRTADTKCTAMLVSYLAKQLASGGLEIKHHEMSVMHHKTSATGKRKRDALNDSKVLLQHILSGVPGLSYGLAGKIVEKFECLSSLCKASSKDLQEVKGVGKELAARILTLV